MDKCSQRIEQKGVEGKILYLNFTVAFLSMITVFKGADSLCLILSLGFGQRFEGEGLRRQLWSMGRRKHFGENLSYDRRGRNLSHFPLFYRKIG